MSVAFETDSQRIRARMQRLRRRMDGDVQGIVENTQRLLDWKDYVRRFPLATLGAGLAIGFFFAPGRKVIPSVKLAEESVKELVEQSAAKAAIKEEESHVSSLMTGVVSAVSGVALSTLTMVLRQQVERYLSSLAKAHDHGMQAH